MIFVRGEQVSGEYRGKGSLLDAEGWFNTRDGGYLDDGGYLFLEGRMDDVIVRGGENMSPGEIEDVLLTHEALLDACVIGIPDERMGEVGMAFVVPVPGVTLDPAILLAWSRDNMANYKVPRHFEIMQELPCNASGKVLKNELRERAKQIV